MLISSKPHPGTNYEIVLNGNRNLFNNYLHASIQLF